MSQVLNMNAQTLTCVQGASGILVQALQDSLSFNGLPINITGNFDENTAKQLTAFKISRSMNTSLPVADFETWHLLTTGCNSSENAAFWIDVGWPQGSVTDKQLQCLREVGFKFITFECWLERNGGTFWEPCVDTFFEHRLPGFRSVCTCSPGVPPMLPVKFLSFWAICRSVLPLLLELTKALAFFLSLFCCIQFSLFQCASARDACLPSGRPCAGRQASHA